MASIIKANQLQDFGGNSIITSDGSGNLTTQKLLYPAFDAYLNVDQSGLTNQAYNLVKLDTTYFDTDNAFDTTDGQHKFTVPSGKAGKYCFYAGIFANPNADNQTEEARIAIYKNGTSFRISYAKYNNTDGSRYAPLTITTVIDLAESDYIQLYFYGYDTNSSHKLESNYTFLGGYRIGS